ncbi:MAG: hypothetical protein H6706_18550 [Myxococcales bacterium]|nr:hypothetical protein [Myxococcales bacterium]
MNARLPLLALALLTGCAGVERASDLAPAPHLLLVGLNPTPRAGYTPPAPIEDPYGGPAYTPADPYAAQQGGEEPLDDLPPVDDGYTPQVTQEGGPAGHPVGAKLRAMEGKTQLEGRRADDVTLVRGAFAGVPGIGPVDDLLSLRGRSIPRREGGIKEGDLLFFSGDESVPAVAVVHRRLPRGIIEAAAVTRGAVRFIRISPLDPHSRRRGRQVANTWLRAVRPGDPPGTARLAGQLLEDVRVLVR